MNEIPVKIKNQEIYSDSAKITNIILDREDYTPEKKTLIHQEYQPIINKIHSGANIILENGSITVSATEKEEYRISIQRDSTLLLIEFI